MIPLTRFAVLALFGMVVADPALAKSKQDKFCEELAYASQQIADLRLGGSSETDAQMMIAGQYDENQLFSTIKLSGLDFCSKITDTPNQYSLTQKWSKRILNDYGIIVILDEFIPSDFIWENEFELNKSLCNFPKILAIAMSTSIYMSVINCISQFLHVCSDALTALLIYTV